MLYIVFISLWGKKYVCVLKDRDECMVFLAVGHPPLGGCGCVSVYATKGSYGCAVLFHC